MTKKDMTKKKKNDTVTQLLKRLQWLPIKYRIMYKINLLTFKCLSVLSTLHLLINVNCV